MLIREHRVGLTVTCDGTYRVWEVRIGFRDDLISKKTVKSIVGI